MEANQSQKKSQKKQHYCHSYFQRGAKKDSLLVNSRTYGKVRSIWFPWELFPYSHGFFLERKHYLCLSSYTDLSWTVIDADAGLCRAAPMCCLAGVYGQADLAIPCVTFSTGALVLVWPQIHTVGVRITDLSGAWVDSLWKKKWSKWISRCPQL